MSILKSIVKFFQNSRQVELDLYVQSQNPQNAADVDRIIREYDSRRHFSF